MKDLKICVYAICKNEEKFVNRFMDHLEEIKDHVYILDTGSTDNTVELFKKRGAHIQKTNYSKFEFDKARNDALALVPKDYDVCMCLDLDDCIEPGFVDKIKKHWKKDTTIMKYTYITRLDENDNPLVSFNNNHIHKRKGYYWTYPIHEVLRYTEDNENVVEALDIVVKHRPDISKSRDFYLELLEEYVKDHPDNTRNIFLLTREYNSKNKWIESITTAHKYLRCSPYYKPEICKIMTIMAKAYIKLECYEEAELWSKKALEQIQDSREPYIPLILLSYKQKEYKKAIDYCKEALKITEYNTLVIDDAACWNGTILDYLSLSYYYIHDYDNAIKYVDMDIEQNPQVERLKENRELFIRAKNREEE